MGFFILDDKTTAMKHDEFLLLNRTSQYGAEDVNHLQHCPFGWQLHDVDSILSEVMKNSEGLNMLTLSGAMVRRNRADRVLNAGYLQCAMKQFCRNFSQSLVVMNVVTSFFEQPTMLVCITDLLEKKLALQCPVSRLYNDAHRRIFNKKRFHRPF